MTATRVQLTGGVFQDSEGNVLANGYLEMVLSQDGAIAGVGQVASGVTIEILLDPNGSVEGTTALVLSSVTAAGVYSGTISGGANNAFAGLTFVVTGFTASAGANNGTFRCTASTATTLTLVNGSAVNETHVGAATASQSVWGNDQLSPVNSYYRVTGFTALGQPAWGPNNQQVVGSGGTFDVGTWVPNTVLSWTPPPQPLELETNGTPNSTQALLDITGSGGIAVSETAGTVTIDGSGITPSVAWGDILGTLSDQTDLQAALDLLAPLASPALTGIPTAPTAAPGTNTTQLATTAFVQAASGGGSVIQIATLAMSSSDILTGFRLQAIAAPGANKIIWPVWWWAEFLPVSTPYSGTGDFDLKTHGVIDTAWTSAGISGLGFWNQTVKQMAAAQILPAFGGASGNQSVSSLVNFPLDVVIGTNPTTGDGTMLVTIAYYVISV